MHDRTRLREALAAALVAAQQARAPDRVLALLRGAYRSLDSARFVDDDMIRWAEAGLGAWRRWSAQNVPSDHHLLVVDASDSAVDGSDSLVEALRALAPELRIARVDAVKSRSATLEALATQPPTAVVFDLDTHDLVPTIEMLEWLAAEFPQIRRIGYARSAESSVRPRERSLYHAIFPKPPTSAQLASVLSSTNDATPHP
ncbi:MAG: hypothetical protein JWM53_3857 [bacterium]|nr:hypothetical protein [bacterium]